MKIPAEWDQSCTWVAGEALRIEVMQILQLRPKQLLELALVEIERSAKHCDQGRELSRRLLHVSPSELLQIARQVLR